MTTIDKVYLSQERYDEIVDEVNSLKRDGRRTIADRLKQAKDLGDLSENFDYQEAREAQAHLEQKINELEELIRNSAIIKKSSGNQTVRIGSKAKVKRGGETTLYTIVGSNEAQPTQGLVSNESPIGKALLGKKVGDIVTVNTPKGAVPYQILDIE